MRSKKSRPRGGRPSRVIVRHRREKHHERRTVVKTAICYYSRHHGNTLQVLKAMAQEGTTDLITSYLIIHK